MQNFQINTLIQLLTSSTCFEPRDFILRKTDVFAFFVWYGYGFFHQLTDQTMHVNIPYKNCDYNCLPEDEPMRLETCRRCRKL